MTAAGLKYLIAVNDLGAAGIKITEISEKMGISKVSVYRAVSRLEASGYTVRDEKNRVVITEQGKEQLEKYNLLTSLLAHHLNTCGQMRAEGAKEDAINAVCAVSDECRDAIFKLLTAKAKGENK